jgi:hypothetical protein
MSVLLLKLVPYLAAAAVFLGIGWYAGGLQPKAALARLQASDAQTRAVEESQALKAVQAQLTQAQTIAANNSQTVEKLNAENAQVVADRDGTLARVRRLEQLLELASHPAAHGSDLPQTGSGQPITPASGTAGNAGLEQLLANASDECNRNADRLDSLSAEIAPQL